MPMGIAMRAARSGFAIGLALLCSGCALPQLSGGAARSGPTWTPLGGSYGGDWLAYPADRQRIVCDRYGRCWRPDAGDDFDHRRVEVHPPGWAADLPDSERKRDRFIRPDANLVCDQATRVCYKRGSIDKSDTKEVFGRRAAKRADQLRDERGTAQIFVPEQGAACDRERRRCFAEGEPDRRLTRRHFGRDAARDIQ
jgi:hypothetical protein